MTRAAALVAGVALLLGGCAAMIEPPKCPAGQQRLRTAQLVFGRDAAGRPAVSNLQFRKFVDEVLTPRFPDGLTVLDGGSQWKGPENRLFRDSSKLVLIVLPRSPDVADRLQQVRDAYRLRFSRESVLLVTQPACVSF